jgi:hypothetical protein
MPQGDWKSATKFRLLTPREGVMVRARVHQPSYPSACTCHHTPLRVPAIIPLCVLSPTYLSTCTYHHTSLRALTNIPLYVYLPSYPAACSHQHTSLRASAIIPLESEPRLQKKINAHRRTSSMP